MSYTCHVCSTPPKGAKYVHGNVTFSRIFAHGIKEGQVFGAEKISFFWHNGFITFDNFFCKIKLFNLATCTERNNN